MCERFALLPSRWTERDGQDVMIKPWESIAQCLRAELADYGGLLHLMDAQERSRYKRDPEAVSRIAAEIESQAQSLANSRCRREQAVATFAKQNNRPASSSLLTLLPLIERDARPLIEALISEVNLLLRRARRASRHDPSLLLSKHTDRLATIPAGATARAGEGQVATASTRRSGGSLRYIAGRR